MTIVAGIVKAVRSIGLLMVIALLVATVLSVSCIARLFPAALSPSSAKNRQR